MEHVTVEDDEMLIDRIVGYLTPVSQNDLKLLLEEVAPFGLGQYSRCHHGRKIIGSSCPRFTIPNSLMRG